MPTKTTAVTVSIPDKLLEYLNVYCGTTGLKRSTVVVYAIEAYLAGEEGRKLLGVEK